ncbi:MAG TPA: hypothetical protein VMF05_15180 [Stellaceae bacterium]|nr:hypothetical protein [Stellaceae bacterium]
MTAEASPAGRRTVNQQKGVTAKRINLLASDREKKPVSIQSDMIAGPVNRLVMARRLSPQSSDG